MFNEATQNKFSEANIAKYQAMVIKAEKRITELRAIAQVATSRANMSMENLADSVDRMFDENGNKKWDAYMHIEGEVGFFNVVYRTNVEEARKANRNLRRMCECHDIWHEYLEHLKSFRARYINQLGAA